MNEVKEWYSITELAEKTEIPEPTARRYITKFQEYFISRGGSRAKKYDSTAIEILKRIKKLFDAGYETEGVREIIKNEFPVIMSDKEKDGMDEKPNLSTLVTGEELAKLEKSILDKIDERFSTQENGISLMIQKLEQLEQQLDQREQRLEKREQLLLNSAKKEEGEEQKEVAAEQPEEEKKGFWKKFFK